MPTRRCAAVGLLPQRAAAALLARDDPHPRLFDAYARPLPVLAASTRRAAAGACAPSSCCCCARSACCPTLDRGPLTLAAARRRRALQPACPRPASSRRGERALRGEPGCAAAGGAAGGATWLHCAPLALPRCRALRSSLRGLLHYHCGAAATAHAPDDDRRCSTLLDRLDLAMNPLRQPAACRHRAVGQPQQGRAGAQHAPPGHPERRARRHAVPGGRRARHHRASAPGRAPHPRARRARAARAAAARGRRPSSTSKATRSTT